MTKDHLLIGIDGNEANVTNRVGSNIYAFQLIKNIYQQLTINNQQLRINIFLKEEPLGDLPKETDWWRYQVVGPKKFWTQFALPRALSQSPPDVFFTPGHYAPRRCGCPLVISIMDLSFIYFPKLFRKRDLWQLKNWTARSIFKAQKILTISQSSKNAIIDYYQVDPSRIVVTYPGMNITINNQSRRSRGSPTESRYSRLFESHRTSIKVSGQSTINNKYGITGDYLLYVGTLQPRKNIERLIEAFNLTIEQSNNEAMKLVIVGKKGWLYDQIFAKVKELKLEDRVIFTGFVPDQDLPALYQNAKCFVLPSLYEGFGLPALEAMAYGCPVVVSNVSSLPEIVGDAGILVDPENIESIAQGIQKVLRLAPQERAELIKKGKERVKLFSWEKCARETLAVLENVAKSSS